MKILYVSQYYPPEIGAPAARVSELSAHWVKAGHEVTVLTGFPNHPTGTVHPEYRTRFKRLFLRENLDGVDVIRTWLWPLPNRKPLERILNYTSFAVSAFIRGSVLRAPDVIVGTSPQLLVPLCAWLLAKLKRRPFVFEVRDIWPDAILASGVSHPGSVLAKMLATVTRFLHKHSDVIVVVTPAFKKELVETWGVESDKVEIVQNGVELELFNPQTTARMDLALAPESFVVAYVGTLGLAHGLDTVLRAAEALDGSDPEIAFVLAGAGAESELLDVSIRERRLTNVWVLGELPRSKIPALLMATDVSLVLLKKAQIFETVIPTKMLEFMAAARPIVLGVDGQARSILDAAGAGMHIEPQNADQLVAAIRTFKDDPDFRARCGEGGRRYVEQNLSRGSTARLYIEIMERMKK